VRHDALAARRPPSTQHHHVFARIDLHGGRARRPPPAAREGPGALAGRRRRSPRLPPPRPPPWPCEERRTVLRKRRPSPSAAWPARPRCRADDRGVDAAEGATAWKIRRTRQVRAIRSRERRPCRKPRPRGRWPRDVLSASWPKSASGPSPVDNAGRSGATLRVAQT